jgi:hypothetical protein
VVRLQECGMGSKMRRIALAALGIFWAAGITRRYSTIMDEDTFALPTISLLRLTSTPMFLRGM